MSAATTGLLSDAAIASFVGGFVMIIDDPWTNGLIVGVLWFLLSWGSRTYRERRARRRESVS